MIRAKFVGFSFPAASSSRRPDRSAAIGGAGSRRRRHGRRPRHPRAAGPDGTTNSLSTVSMWLLQEGTTPSLSSAMPMNRRRQLLGVCCRTFLPTPTGIKRRKHRLVKGRGVRLFRTTISTKPLAKRCHFQFQDSGPTPVTTKQFPGSDLLSAAAGQQSQTRKAHQSHRGAGGFGDGSNCYGIVQASINCP